jgi:hypothetical protein
MKRLSPWALCATLGLALTSGCGESSGSSGCTSDNDCGAGLFCDEDGACKCRTDDVCGAGRYCNPFGTCQNRPACLGNLDCDDGYICNSSDPSGGKCIPAASCGSSTHCPFNQFCRIPQASEERVGTCEPGCRRTGDCQLGYVCVSVGHCAGAGTVCSSNQQCDDGAACEFSNECTPAGTADDCTTCPAAPDPDNSYCDYGEVCTFDGECVSHALESELCADCGPSSSCPDGMRCMVDTVSGGGYCAPECTHDIDCPAGYPTCLPLILVNAYPCDHDNGFGPCDCAATDGVCPNGGTCLGSAEGSSAYCECTSQDDCTRLNPTTACVQVPLTTSGTAGVCQTDNWGACSKPEGVTCAELTAGTAICRGL